MVRLIFPMILMMGLAKSVCADESSDAPRLFQERSFNAAILAEAVNHFVAIGEKATLKEWKKITSVKFAEDAFTKKGFNPDERIGWVSRILYESKDGKPIPIIAPVFLPASLMPLEDWPHFPLVKTGSTYFVLAEGWKIAGQYPDMEAYIQYCQAHGNFRKKPISIPTKDQAVKDASLLFQSRLWKDLWLKLSKELSEEKSGKWSKATQFFILGQTDSI